MNVARYRDLILVTVGTALLVSQGAAFWLTGKTDPALITAGTSLLGFPLVLAGDKMRHK